MYNVVVAENNAAKKPVNFSLPTSLWREFNELSKREAGGKQKWAAISAGILLLCEVPEAVRSHYIGKVLAAQPRQSKGSFEELVAQAKSGELRKSVPKTVPEGHAHFIPETENPPSNPKPGHGGSQGGSAKRRK